MFQLLSLAFFLLCSRADAFPQQTPYARTNSSSSVITPSPVIGTAVATTAPPSCNEQCSGSYPQLYSIGWSIWTSTANVTVATVIYVVNDRTNKTRTSTQWATVPDYTKPDINADGTVFTTLTLADNKTTTLNYPTSYLDYKPVYSWIGTLLTTETDHPGTTICSTNSVFGGVTLSSHPVFPQPTNVVWPDDYPEGGDRYGFNAVISAGDGPVTDWWGTEFSEERALATPSLCSWSLVGPVGILSGQAYLTATSTVHETDDPSTAAATSSTADVASVPPIPSSKSGEFKAHQESSAPLGPIHTPQIVHEESSATNLGLPTSTERVKPTGKAKSTKTGVEGGPTKKPTKTSQGAGGVILSVINHGGRPSNSIGNAPMIESSATFLGSPFVAHTESKITTPTVANTKHTTPTAEAQTQPGHGDGHGHMTKHTGGLGGVIASVINHHGEGGDSHEGGGDGHQGGGNSNHGDSGSGQTEPTGGIQAVPTVVVETPITSILLGQTHFPVQTTNLATTNALGKSTTVPVVIVGSQTFTASGTKTINGVGVVFSTGSSGNGGSSGGGVVIIGGSMTVTLPAASTDHATAAAEPTATSSNPLVYTVNGQPMTLQPGNTLIIGSGPSEKSVGLSTNSAGESVLVINGVPSTTITPPPSAVPITINALSTTLSPSTFTSDGSTITGYMLGTETLTLGGSATISGKTVELETNSAGKTVIVINSKTSTLSAAKTTTSTTRGIGGLINSGLQGPSKTTSSSAGGSVSGSQGAAASWRYSGYTGPAWWLQLWTVFSITVFGAAILL